MEIVERVKKVVANILVFDDLSKIDITSSLRNDLGADDLDIAGIIMALENEFNINITDDEFENRSLRVQTLVDLVLDIKGLEPVKPKTKKTVNKRVIKFTEYTYDDGSISIKPSVKGWNDMELIGMLHYYLDLFTVNAIRGNAK